MYIGAWQEYQAYLYSVKKQKEPVHSGTKLQPLFENEKTKNVIENNLNNINSDENISSEETLSRSKLLDSGIINRTLQHKPTIHHDHAFPYNSSRQLKNKKLPSLIISPNDDSKTNISTQTKTEFRSDDDSIKESVLTSKSEPTPTIPRNLTRLNNTKPIKQTKPLSSSKHENTEKTNSSRVNSSRQDSSRSKSSNNSNSNGTSQKKANKHKSSKNVKQNEEVNIEKKIQNVQKVKALYMQKPSSENDIRNMLSDLNFKDMLPAVNVAKASPSMASKISASTKSTDTNTIGTNNTNLSYTLDPSKPVTITDMNLERESFELQVISKYFQLPSIQQISVTSNNFDTSGIAPSLNTVLSSSSLPVVNTSKSISQLNLKNSQHSMMYEAYQSAGMNDDDENLENNDKKDTVNNNIYELNMLSHDEQNLELNNDKRFDNSSSQDTNLTFQDTSYINKKPPLIKSMASNHNKKNYSYSVPSKTGIFDELYTQNSGTESGGMDNLLDWSLNLKFP